MTTTEETCSNTINTPCRTHFLRTDSFNIQIFFAPSTSVTLWLHTHWHLFIYHTVLGTIALPNMWLWFILNRTLVTYFRTKTHVKAKNLRTDHVKVIVLA